MLERRPVPALEHAAPAVPASSEGAGTGGPAGAAPFHGLNMAFARTGRGHPLIPTDTLYSKSPVNGLLFVHGTIGQCLFWLSQGTKHGSLLSQGSPCMMLLVHSSCLPSRALVQKVLMPFETLQDCKSF